jgi:hypothetical protein
VEYGALTSEHLRVLMIERGGYFRKTEEGLNGVH